MNTHTHTHVHQKRYKRYFKIGLATLVGGALIAITGGLAGICVSEYVCAYVVMNAYMYVACVCVYISAYIYIFLI